MLKNLNKEMLNVTHNDKLILIITYYLLTIFKSSSQTKINFYSLLIDRICQNLIKLLEIHFDRLWNNLL
jgi:hypothetical protein